MAPRTSAKRPRSPRTRAIDGLSLDDLTRMSRAELLETWARVVGKAPVRNASRQLLISTVAWYLQAQRHGGLAPTVQRKLERLAAAIDRGEPARPLTAIERLRPGTILERSWRSETHTVSVIVDGFAYRGRRYRSLSEVARLITGTRWNGPAFFGLRQTVGKASQRPGDAT